jgi:signal transduction histidine kinase
MMRRDLHDQVGCSLAGMGLQLEFARRLIDTDTARADRVLADLRSDITELIVDVRRILGNREMQSICNVEAVLRLMIGRMGRAVAPRLEISLEIDPEVSSVLDDVGSVAVWMVREAVVNVLKHSTARHCSVSVLVQEGALCVRVADDGDTRPERRSRGYGLVNMSERAQERGGWCNAGPAQPRGFAVEAFFPSAVART